MLENHSQEPESEDILQPGSPDAVSKETAPEPGAEGNLIVETIPPAEPEEAVVEAGEELEAEKPQDVAVPDKRWYVIHTLSGQEQKVRYNLARRIDSMNMKQKIFSVLVPTEEEVEIKGGKKRVVQRKIFPGYVLVEMVMSDDSWYVVRNTSGVTGFVGSGSKPIPLPEEEVKQILKQASGEAPRRRLTLKTGDKVRITSGPFVEFYGAIQEVNPEKEKIKVLVSIFGRETPVELDYAQVEKL